LQTSITAFQAAVIRDVNAGGLSRNQAIEKNKGILQKNQYTYLQPEQVKSLEFGYRALFLKSRLLVDADLYFNNYRKFIAQANMTLPNTSVPDSIPYYLNERATQSPYRMWTNSQSAVYNYGFSIGLSYILPKGFNINGNTTFAKLTRSDTQDGLEDGFNTPAWIVNASVSNATLWKQFGAGITWRWQSSFYWQSFLVNGQVPAFGTVDAHITCRMKKMPVSLKLGGSNIFNHYYRSFLGGPSVGGFYYCTFSLSLAKL
jgi:outer membrane receptor protein involved in Fe transport